MSRPLPILAILVPLVAIIFAVSPLLSQNFAGYSSDQFPIKIEFSPVQPAGWAFSIWGVIYLWLIVGGAMGLLNAPNDPQWRAMRVFLLASLGIGVFWIAAAGASPILATVMIFVMAALAIIAMLRAGTELPIWQVRPTALYAGWLTAATGAGTGVVLGGYGVLSPQGAALLMLVLVLVVALFVQSRRPSEWGYPLAVIWALAGVISANMPSQNWPVIGLAIVGIVALAAGYILRRKSGLAHA